MTLVPLGEAAYIVRDLPAKPYLVADALADLSIPGLLEVAPAWDTLGLFVDPTVFDPKNLPDPLPSVELGERQTHIIEVRFDGADLEASAHEVGLTPSDLIQLFCSAEYRCRCVGFQPGFPYLEGLPPALTNLKRLPEPRVRVPKGSVAIAAGQAGIYPAESPGGWRLLGVTDFEIRKGPLDFAIAPGDGVRFTCASST